jgi:hypothetical protein
LLEQLLHIEPAVVNDRKEILAFHHLTPSDRQFWTHAALIFTIIYAVFVTANVSSDWSERSFRPRT